MERQLPGKKEPRRKERVKSDGGGERERERGGERVGKRDRKGQKDNRESECIREIK